MEFDRMNKSAQSQGGRKEGGGVKKGLSHQDVYGYLIGNNINQNVCF